MKWLKVTLVAAVFVAANATLLGIAWCSQATVAAAPETTAEYTLPVGVERMGVSDIRKTDTAD